MKQIFFSFLILFILNVSAQKKQQTWAITRAELIKETFMNTTEPALPDNQYKVYSTSALTERYTITAKSHKKGGLLKGLLIGGGIGLLPLAAGSIFGKSSGEAGAYISMVTFPVGIIAGAIIGATSKKRKQTTDAH